MYSTVSMTQPPKWSIQSNLQLKSQQQQQDQNSSPRSDNTDDHYSRHLETVPNDVQNDGEDHQDEDVKRADENNDEEEEVKDDEPKVFQVEDVDLPSLITKPNSPKPKSPLINALKPAENSNFNKPVSKQ